MTSITAQLRPEVERILREKARLQGRTLEVYFQQLAEREAGSPNGTSPLPREPTPSEKVAGWQSWVAGHLPLPTIADDRRVRASMRVGE